MVSKALVIAYAVHEYGRREVIGLDLGEVESEAFWIEFLRGLRSRGLDGRAAGRLRPPRGAEDRDRPGARRARGSAAACTSSRNMHGHCRPAQRGMVSAALREVFNAPDGAEARRRVGDVIDRLGAGRAEGLRSCSRPPRRTCWPSTRFPAAHWTKLRSTNPLERVNREIGRRSDVVGIFPNDAAAIRLAGALLIEQNDEWLVSRRYLSEESMRQLPLAPTTDPRNLPISGSEGGQRAHRRLNRDRRHRRASYTTTHDLTPCDDQELMHRNIEFSAMRMQQ